MEQGTGKFRLIAAASAKSAAVVRAEFTRAIDEAGATGVPVCLHSSLSAHGYIEGGAAAMVDAFRSVGSTLLVPTFTGAQCEVLPAPAGDRPARNGMDYSDEAVVWPDAPYDPDTTPPDRSMGAVPVEVLGRPRRRRGAHPTDSFATLGPDGPELMAGEPAGHVFAPLRALADLGGVVILAGVGLERMTLLHLAEVVAGRAPFRRWALAAPGVVAVECGGCSQGFGALGAALAPVERTVEVGAAVWRAFPASAAVELAAAAIRREPEVTRCADPACLRCRDAIAGGPLLEERPG